MEDEIRKIVSQADREKIMKAARKLGLILEMDFYGEEVIFLTGCYLDTETQELIPLD